MFQPILLTTCNKPFTECPKYLGGRSKGPVWIILCYLNCRVMKTVYSLTYVIHGANIHFINTTFPQNNFRSIILYFKSIFQITYITSFGGEDELQPHSKISINFNKNPTTADSRYKSSGDHSGQTSVSYADKVRENLDKLKTLNNMVARNSTSESPKKPLAYQRRRSPSRSRSRSFDRRRRDDSIRKRRSRSRSQSRSRRHRSRSNSRNRSSRFSRSGSHYRTSSRRSRSPRRRRHRSTSTTSSSSSNDSRRRRRRRPASSSSSSTSPASSSSSSSSSRSSLRRRPRSRIRSKSPAKRVRSETPEDRHTLKAESVADRLLFTVPEPIKSPAPIPAPIPAVNAIIIEEPVIPIRRYYGRKRDNQTSSEEDGEESVSEAQEEISR